MQGLEPGKGRAIAAALLTLGIFAAALWVLDDSLRHLDPADLLVPLRQLSAQQLFGAIGWTAASYFALTLYDALALDIIGRPLPYRRVATISFIACALAHSLGLASLSGGSVRLRAYSNEGISAADIALVQGLFSLTFLLGAGTLLSGSLLLEPHAAARLLHLSIPTIHLIGATLLSGMIGYAAVASLRQRPLQLRHWRIATPRTPATRCTANWSPCAKAGGRGTGASPNWTSCRCCGCAAVRWTSVPAWPRCGWIPAAPARSRRRCGSGSCRCARRRRCTRAWPRTSRGGRCAGSAPMR